MRLVPLRKTLAGVLVFAIWCGLDYFRLSYLISVAHPFLLSDLPYLGRCTIKVDLH